MKSLIIAVFWLVIIIQNKSYSQEIPRTKKELLNAYRILVTEYIVNQREIEIEHSFWGNKYYLKPKSGEWLVPIIYENDFHMIINSINEKEASNLLLRSYVASNLGQALGYAAGIFIVALTVGSIEQKKFLPTGTAITLGTIGITIGISKWSENLRLKAVKIYNQKVIKWATDRR